MAALEQQEQKKKELKLKQEQRQKEKEASMIALSFDDQYLRRSNTGLRASGGIDFIQHTALTACLIVRDGARSGRFATCKTQSKLHITAVMLLVTVIMDLKVGFGYFYRHLHGTTTKTLQLPKALLSVASDAFEELQRTRGFGIAVRQANPADLACEVDLTGTARHVDEAEQIILKLLESTTVSEKLSQLAFRVADCKMED